MSHDEKFTIRYVVDKALGYGSVAAGGLLAGGIAGWLAAPGNWLVLIVGLVALPVSFVAGVITWQLAILLGILARALTRPGPPPPHPEHHPPPGMPALALGTTLLSSLVGAGVALALAGRTLADTMPPFALAGLVYGLVLYALARAGLLPMLKYFQDV